MAHKALIAEGRRKKEEGRRKKEEGRRKKEEGKILCCLSFTLLICPRPFLRLLYLASSSFSLLNDL
ncbi:hypothetical protein [Okeania sp. SIO2B3]|uniref:hypothetical protein n=1 Tax=Okeania sp. SIO2B3 TaxID=2607784 RepID=UPI0013C0A34F|nr:hypothetical protein [Okeania sp. SIO2B3]NET44706.1 hypothetical protein [Okeania sp. SIO2B3]